MRRTVLIYNPRAGRWRTRARVGRIVAGLRRLGYEPESIETEAPGHATRIARDHAGRGVEVVFAFGGDGTLREVAAGLLGSDTALAPLPGGTVNVVPYAFGLDGGAERAVERLGDATIREIDVGLCGDEPFLMMASGGLDAHVLAHVRSEKKRRFGRLAVAATALRTAGSYAYPESELSLDGETLRGTFFSVSNLPFYGGPFRIAPEARVDDRTLDLVVFAGSGRATLGFALDLARGHHATRDDVMIRRVRRVRWLEGSDVAIQLDGDIQPGLAPPLEIRLAADKLRLLVPRSHQRV